MTTITMTDHRVRRVLDCLNAPRSKHQHLSLEELTAEYNGRRPLLQYLPKIGFFQSKPESIKEVIDFLVDEGYATGEVYNFIRRVVLDVPTKYYEITSKGIDFLGRLR